MKNAILTLTAEEVQYLQYLVTLDLRKAKKEFRKFSPGDKFLKGELSNTVKFITQTKHKIRNIVTES